MWSHAYVCSCELCSKNWLHTKNIVELLQKQFSHQIIISHKKHLKEEDLEVEDLSLSANVRASQYPRLADIFTIEVGDSETIWISASSEHGHHHFSFNFPLKHFGVSAREVCGISGRCANYIDVNGADPMNILDSHHRMAPFELSLKTTYNADKIIYINSLDAPEFWIQINKVYFNIHYNSSYLLHLQKGHLY